MFRRNILIVILSTLALNTKAQEIQSKVTVMAQRVNTTVDKKIFTTLQNQLTNFINNRKWTKDTYLQQEKIECNFLLNIESIVETNVYKASLTVQAARPVFNTGYQAALINFQDAEVTFKYVEYQPVEFNETRVAGNDPIVANLTAVFAYYVNVILGLDYDSFSPKAGDIYFQKALNIVNNAPDSRNINGWKPFDGLRNRYWLVENLQNSRYNVIHDIIFEYYRDGLDKLYDDDATGRKNILSALGKLQNFNTENPNTMILQFFMQSKSSELIGIFKKAPLQDKNKALELLLLLDIPNTSKYKDELK